MNRILLGAAALAAAAGPTFAQPIPNGHRPPPGECRVWHPNRPPGHQPPPTNCQRAQYEAARYGGRVVWGGHGGRDERRGYDDHDEDRWVRVCVQIDPYGRCVRTELRQRW